MKVNKSREELIEVLSNYIPEIIQDSNNVNEIADHLYNKHNINLGKLMFYFNDPSNLKEAETSEIALIAEQIHLKLEDAEELNLTNWFNSPEIKEIRQYYYVSEEDKDRIELPYTFENVAYLGDGVYQVPVDLTVIARMYNSGKLNYNFEIQREGRLKKVGNEVIQEMKIYHKNVNEIKSLVLQGLLKKTALAYNCAAYTSEDETEQELIFDEKNNTLTITKGTRIDVLDGTHRTMGIYEAYMDNPNLEGKMTVLFSNFSTAQAKEYQVQLAKATPFNKSRAKELAQERLADELVSRMKSEGVLKGRIASTNRINREVNQLTSSEILSDAFDKHWKPEKRSEINKILNAFNEYLEYLFEYFDDYIDDKDNLLFNKFFFIGHIILAKKMYENDRPFEQINEILSKYDFNKNNKIWQQLGILNESGKFSERKGIKQIEKLFSEL